MPVPSRQQVTAERSLPAARPTRLGSVLRRQGRAQPWACRSCLLPLKHQRLLTNAPVVADPEPCVSPHYCARRLAHVRMIDQLTPVMRSDHRFAASCTGEEEFKLAASSGLRRPGSPSIHRGDLARSSFSSLPSVRGKQKRTTKGPQRSHKGDFYFCPWVLDANLHWPAAPWRVALPRAPPKAGSIE